MCSRQNSKSNEWWRPKDGTFFSDVYYRGDHSIEGWLENAYFSIEQRTHREVSGVKAILPLRKEDSILDSPCGWGKHSLCLAAQGFNVTGLDINQRYLALAKATAQACGYQNTPIFREGDMRKLPFEGGTFNVVLNLILSFGFFNDDGNEQVLMEFSRVLKKGGQCLIHTDINPARVLNNTYEDREERTLADGSTLLVNEFYDEKLKSVLGTWTIRETSGYEIKRNYTLRIYTNKEMEKLFTKAGMKLTSIYGSLDSPPQPYTEESQEVVYVAQKI